MTTSNIQEIRQLTDEELKDAILQVTKDKLELRFKKATKQSFKPHLFQYNRCRLAQLLTVQKEVSNKI
uniref:ribosomal protein L29 n=1 Tax=Rhodella violacea TaxID=2801 RepID=UPI001FCD234B|nr:ribosomal protein L29 [Rhodella violacea]UNJ18035.1 ribosomal protein L29 [Rhodella violacea]